MQHQQQHQQPESTFGGGGGLMTTVTMTGGGPTSEGGSTNTNTTRGRGINSRTAAIGMTAAANRSGSSSNRRNQKMLAHANVKVVFRDDFNLSDLR
mmetsp:Transcript_10049/g.24224  ORF Transcript_10049/g.24224 Transcript_10049/m.24224 type:complete len:96 (-) Transcript_10049:29-316(-)